MAQVAMIDGAQAVKMGAELPAVADLIKQKINVVPAKDLIYADRKAWKVDDKNAEFLGGGNPKVHGDYDVKKLDKGQTYGVYFYMSMNKSSHQVTSPVKLTLGLPDGTKQEKIEILTLNPGEWKPVSVGIFENSFPSGDINFKFSGVTGDTWKGLLLKCVLIMPPF